MKNETTYAENKITEAFNAAVNNSNGVGKTLFEIMRDADAVRRTAATGTPTRKKAILEYNKARTCLLALANYDKTVQRGLEGLNRALGLDF